jgi:hypothetical protein
VNPSGTVTFLSGPNNLKVTKGVGNNFVVNSLNSCSPRPAARKT